MCLFVIQDFIKTNLPPKLRIATNSFDGINDNRTHAVSERILFFLFMILFLIYISISLRSFELHVIKCQISMISFLNALTDTSLEIMNNCCKIQNFLPIKKACRMMKMIA